MAKGRRTQIRSRARTRNQQGDKPEGRTRRRRRRAQPLDQHMRRRRSSRLIISALLVVAILVIAWWDRRDPALDYADDWGKYNGRTVEVLRVIDGDTIDIRMPDGDQPYTRVRLWGVDTPELAKDGYAAEPFADQARDATIRLIDHAPVRLIMQEQRHRGEFGRLLAYVTTDDGQDVSAALIERGLGQTMPAFEHDREEAYEALQRQAKQAGEGLWGR